MRPSAALATRQVCEAPCQELKALRNEVRQNKIASDKDWAALKLEGQRRQETHDKKMDAILGEIQGLRKFMEEWVKRVSNR